MMLAPPSAVAPACGAIPVAGADELAAPARRLTAARAGLALALLAACAAAVVAARGLEPRSSTYFAGTRGGVIVIDFSTSIDPSKYRRLARVVRTMADTGQPVGLVVYSDTAYEAVPPGTSGEVLRPLLRFFAPPGNLPAQGRFRFPESPWTTTFRGGTRISAGLRVARQMLAREGIRDGSVVLVSDLDDSPFDTRRLTEELIRYREEGLDLRLVALNPSREDRDTFRRLAGPAAFVRHTELLANSARDERRTLVGSFPLPLVLAAGVLLLLLAANERLCGRLRWRPGGRS
jgi:hypothetical protein